jgi:hypothetical protein
MSRTKRENGKDYRWSPGLGEWVEVDVAPSNAKPTAKSKQLKTAFIQKLPLELAAKAFKANRQHKPFVFVWLLYRRWREKGTMVSIPNGELEQYGIHRREKMKSIRDYERVGLLKLHKAGRKSVIVELLFEVEG